MCNRRFVINARVHSTVWASSVDPYEGFRHWNANSGGRKKKFNNACHTYNIKQTNLKSIGKKRKLESGLKWLFVWIQPQITQNKKNNKSQRGFFFLSCVVLYSIFLIIYYSLLWTYVHYCDGNLWVGRFGCTAKWSDYTTAEDTSGFWLGDVTCAEPMRKRVAQRSCDDVIWAGIIIAACSFRWWSK